MVVRDKDLLADIFRRTRSTVTMNIPTVDEEAWHKLEPGPPPAPALAGGSGAEGRRGLRGVLMAPIVPGITSHPAKLERTIKAIVDHGATYVGGLVMHLEGGTRDHFLGFLQREFPNLVERYGHLYAGKCPSRSYTQRVRVILGTLRARYG